MLCENIKAIRKSKGLSQEAVSYTHLDVYKRQALGQRGGERSKLCREGKNDGLLQKMWCIDR